jgi:succinyl-CoA synthetase alpha subunit
MSILIGKNTKVICQGFTGLDDGPIPSDMTLDQSHSYT